MQAWAPPYTLNVSSRFSGHFFSIPLFHFIQHIITHYPALQSNSCNLSTILAAKGVWWKHIDIYSETVLQHITPVRLKTSYLPFFCTDGWSEPVITGLLLAYQTDKSFSLMDSTSTSTSVSKIISDFKYVL